MQYRETSALNCESDESINQSLKQLECYVDYCSSIHSCRPSIVSHPDAGLSPGGLVPQSTISLSVISLFSLSFCSSMIYSPDILSEASHLRQGVPCSFAVEGLYRGGSQRVFKIVFEDSVQWTA
jgi:hypothetical protein